MAVLLKRWKGAWPPQPHESAATEAGAQVAGLIDPDMGDALPASTTAERADLAGTEFAAGLQPRVRVMAVLLMKKV